MREAISLLGDGQWTSGLTLLRALLVERYMPAAACLAAFERRRNPNYLNSKSYHSLLKAAAVAGNPYSFLFFQSRKWKRILFSIVPIFKYIFCYFKNKEEAEFLIKNYYEIEIGEFKISDIEDDLPNFFRIYVKEDHKYFRMIFSNYVNDFDKAMVHCYFVCQNWGWELVACDYHSNTSAIVADKIADTATLKQFERDIATMDEKDRFLGWMSNYEEVSKQELQQVKLYEYIPREFS